MTIGRPLKFKSFGERIGYVLNHHPMWASRLSIKNGLIAIIWVSVVVTLYQVWPLSAATWIAIVLTGLVTLWMACWTVVDVKRWRRAKEALRERPEEIAAILRDHDFRVWVGMQLYAGRHRDHLVPPGQLLLTVVILTQHRTGRAPRWLRRRIAAIGPCTQAIATELAQEQG
jgi:ABC-type nickel/cobalt efflux system permease component RcnA